MCPFAHLFFQLRFGLVSIRICGFGYSFTLLEFSGDFIQQIRRLEIKVLRHRTDVQTSASVTAIILVLLGKVL